MRASLLPKTVTAVLIASGSPWHRLSTALIAVCWGLFAVVWLGGALYNAHRGPAVRRRPARSHLWLAGLIAAWLLLGMVPAGDWRRLTVSAPWLRAIGTVLLVCSTAFTLWARLVLGSMWSSFVVIKEEHQLRTDGPYAITRHPIYTGMLGMLAGSTLLAGFGRWAAWLLVAFLIVTAKLRAEERLLGEVFGADYERYRQRVPQLVPGLRHLKEPRHR